MVKFERDKGLEVDFSAGYTEIIRNLQKSQVVGADFAISSEFLKLQCHPSTRDLSGLASLVYNKPKSTNGTGWLKDYVLLCVGSSKETGYRGAIFYRCKNSERHHQIVIAHKGTDSSKDLEADMDGVVKNKLTPQMNSCCTFVLDFIAKISPPPTKLDTDMMTCLSSPQISTTGHSLGGWLSQISTFAMKYLQLTGDSFELRPRNDKNSWDIHPHCEVFDSPGAYQIIQKLSSLQSFRSLKLQTQNFGLDICNFTFSPNAVNVINQHLGDMFLLPIDTSSVQLVQPRSFLSLSNLTFTKETHKISLFLENLETNPNPRFTRVEEWALVLFRNWDSSKNVGNKFHKVLGLVGTAMVKIFSSVTAEYEDFIKSGMNVAVSDYALLRINIHSLSAREQEVVEILRAINILKNLNPGSFQLSKELAITEIESLLDNLSSDNVSNPNHLHFPGMEDFTILHNCGILKHKIKEFSRSLENFEVGQCFYRSAKFVDYLLEKFICLDFNELGGQEWEKVFTFNCPESAELFCLKIASFIRQEKGGLSIRNSLLLKYNDILDIIDGTEITDFVQSFPNQILHAFIDCTEVPGIDTKLLAQNSGNCRLIYLIIDENSTQYLNHCAIMESSHNFQQISKQEVTFAGVSVTLGELSGSNCIREVCQVLLKEVKYLNILLQRAPLEKLELGFAPPSIYDNITIYTEPCWTFESVQEALEMFRDKISEDFGPGKILIYGGGAHGLAEHLRKEGLSCVAISCSDVNPVLFFQKLVKNDPTSVFELVEYNHRFLEWKLHYNPNLYMARQIVPPALDLSPLARLRPAIFVKSSDPGSGLEVLELNLSPNWRQLCNLDNFESILGNCFGDNAPNLASLDKIQSMQFRPESGGGCNFLQQKLHGETLQASFYKPKELCEEKDLLKQKQGRTLFCFSDNPGMGKSFLMVKLANNILKEGKNWNWLFFLELRKLVGFHLVNIPNPLMEELDKEEIASFLVLNLNLDPFRSLLFTQVLANNSSKLTFILDGFDELPNQHKQKFCKILLHLRKYSDVSLAVSTRQRDNISIETSLGILSHRLVPLDGFHSFLFNTWRGVLRQPEYRQKLATFSGTLLSKVDLKLGVDRLFLGIPLHLKMLSVAFQQSALEFCRGSGDLESYIPTQYGLRFLLDRFIDAKYKLFFNKLGWQDESREDHWAELKPVLIYKFETELEFIAGNILELGKPFEELMWDFRREKRNLCFPSDIYRVGIVLRVAGRPEFLHRSIAEYYVANCIYLCFKQLLNPKLQEDGEVTKLVTKLYPVCKVAVFEIGARLVRLFLNQLIANDGELVSSLKAGNFPRIADSVEDCLLECVYEVVRREYGSKFFFSLAINSFLNWRNTAEAVGLVMCLSSLALLPPTVETLECVFLLIHGNVVQLGIEESMLKLQNESWPFKQIAGLLNLEDHDLTWFRFRLDLKAMIQSDFKWPGFKVEISPERFTELEESMRDDHGIQEVEFGKIVQMVDWMFDLVERLKEGFSK